MYRANLMANMKAQSLSERVRASLTIPLLDLRSVAFPGENIRDYIVLRYKSRFGDGVIDDFAHQQALAACSGELQISVRFDGGCWLVECSPSFETLTYLSGSAAEEAARRVAARFARQGQAVHVVIEDRRHALVGTQTYFACEPPHFGSTAGQP